MLQVGGADKDDSPARDPTKERGPELHHPSKTDRVDEEEAASTVLFLQEWKEGHGWSSFPHSPEEEPMKAMPLEQRKRRGTREPELRTSDRSEEELDTRKVRRVDTDVTPATTFGGSRWECHPQLPWSTTPPYSSGEGDEEAGTPHVCTCDSVVGEVPEIEATTAEAPSGETETA
ncbi:hypothetical protein EAI_08491 [Harpegnathos saltator]|uniref:Uncharacterized protein n=1 Tax=Harpegnathos saltator TaxID=610380 RepID=E2C5Z3_HARSA|nr:hypothetical protein EAI_08491 [Harpegnathos saltator]